VIDSSKIETHPCRKVHPAPPPPDCDDCDVHHT